MLIRWVFGLPGAIVVTAGLFLFMAGMIAERGVPPLVEPPPKIDILARLKPVEPESTPPKPTSILQVPPPPVDTRWTRDNDVAPGPVIDPTPLPGPDRSGGPVGPTISTPRIQTQPAYPEACAARGVEGVVEVEFDVTPEGDVVNPRIVSSPDRCFDREVLRTVTRWKYEPAFDGDRAVARRGVRAYVTFVLET